MLQSDVAAFISIGGFPMNTKIDGEKSAAVTPGYNVHTSVERPAEAVFLKG
jgi:hypothetical protein